MIERMVNAPPQLRSLDQILSAALPRQGTKVEHLMGSAQVNYYWISDLLDMGKVEEAEKKIDYVQPILKLLSASYESTTILGAYSQLLERYGMRERAQ